ncbi:hypothetical protein D9619_001396 [Psilocybe cf. subviscida]|uniref:Uncharacterized protein n=1 Tax=Psilocybe cf. subviscida TaxID=2480587 RepID=A0A8H5BDJ0_9AGAR|nr:hypothetical protein D9619_001396 [Psilocybe cf. subviscida]
MSLSTSFFSAFSFLTFILVCIPFPWHLEAWNTGTCLYMFWTALGLLSLFINSVIWADNAIDWAPVWCDITSRVIIAISVAIPAASLCINHRLYAIAAVRSVTRTKAEKRRAIMVDLAIGLGLPLIAVALQYIVQGHRYNIFEEVGCYPFTYNTPPAYLLVWALPLVIGMTSAVYSVLSIREFRKRHTEFKEILSSNSNLSPNRFFRLMALAGVEAACCIPLSITTIVLNATRAPIYPWISWQDTHFGFSRVDQIPAVQWRSDPNANTGLEMTRWLVVVCGLVFFAFFGFADEAQKHYRLAFNSVAKRVGLSTGGSATKIGSNMMTKSGGFSSKSYGASSVGMSSQGGGLPVYVRQEVLEKRDSFDSFSDDLSIKDSEYDETEISETPLPTLTKEKETPAAEKSTLDVPGPTHTAPSASPSPSSSYLDLSDSVTDASTKV